MVDRKSNPVSAGISLSNYQDLCAVANNPRQLLETALRRFDTGIALASSFSLEDTALIDMLMKINPAARIFAIDTGRLNEETLECAEHIRRRYGTRIEWFIPDGAAVEQLVKEKGCFSFKESIENRQECCFIRKVEPLIRSLQGLEAWITGQRQEQSDSRANIQVMEIDSAHGNILKLNPLAHWSFEQVRDYVKANYVPYNRLYDLGYRSIGCSPCTRSVKEGDHERAGRWWWEDGSHKECGIHTTGLSLQRIESRSPENKEQ